MFVTVDGPLQEIVTSAVSDGGPSEIMALHSLARSFFTNCNHVSRDRSHRARSLQKGCWTIMNDMTAGLLSALTTDEQSLCRMLQTSHKYSHLFRGLQKPGSADCFTREVRNFSFAAQRFDSLAVPLLKIVHMLPVVYRFLAKLTEVGDGPDQKWAVTMLQRLTGVAAYHDIVRAALAADAMVIGHRMIRMDDAAENNPINKASEVLAFHFNIVVA